MTDDLRATLAARAYLFDDPDAYRAGVEDALRAVAALTSRDSAAS